MRSNHECSSVKTSGSNTAWEFSFAFDKSFIWPDDIPSLAYCSRPTMVSDGPPRQVNIKHQADVLRRDRLMEKDDQDTRAAQQR
ncbi:hypothetical protein E4U30_008041 [Claviceps sp. LM220 group G6]|nr:hypothetical protein E4U30_008041 [Claviceps sp. LM220 group G6]